MEQDPDKNILREKGVHIWQIRAFFSAGILYLFYYFCKYNLSAATPGIKEEFGFTDQTFGWILTAFLLVYAFGQFVNGFLGDRYGPKLILAIGALGVTLIASLVVPAFRKDPILLWAGCFWMIAQGASLLWFFQGLERMKAVASLELGAKAVATACILLWVRMPEHAWRVFCLQGVASCCSLGISLVLAARQVSLNRNTIPGSV